MKSQPARGNYEYYSHLYLKGLFGAKPLAILMIVYYHDPLAKSISTIEIFIP